MGSLTDGFGRRFPYLRLSIIEACNYRCSYCLPEGYRPGLDAKSPLQVEEISRLLKAFAAVGMSKVRITGGEPTLRKDLPDIIAAAAAVPGIAKIAMTSNGCMLKTHSRRWREAGLTHLNISVDTLNAKAFQAITGHDRLADILDGIEALLAEGFQTVKLNAVLLRDLNDDQLPAWLEYLRTRPLGVRFIELMQTGTHRAYFDRHHYRAEALEKQLQDSGWTVQPVAADAGPARVYRHPEYAGSIGVIAPYSKDFCAGCNRLRVTSIGDLRLCLFGNTGIPLRQYLHSDADSSALQSALISQLGLKAIGHRLHEGDTGLVPHLASIGG